MKKSRMILALILVLLLLSLLFGCSAQAGYEGMLTEFFTSDKDGRFTDYKAGMLLLLQDDINTQPLRYEALSEKYHSGVGAYMTAEGVAALRTGGGLVDFDNKADNLRCTVALKSAAVTDAGNGKYTFTAVCTVTRADGNVTEGTEAGWFTTSGGKVSEIGFDDQAFEGVFGQ